MPTLSTHPSDYFTPLSSVHAFIHLPPFISSITVSFFSTNDFCHAFLAYELYSPLRMALWINNEVWVGGGQIDPEGSGSLPNSHSKWVDNSGSATTVLPTKYLYNDAKHLFFVWKVSAFLNCRPSLLFWSRDTNLTQQSNQHQEKHSCREKVAWDNALVVPRLLPLPWQGIPHPKWTWKAVNMHK